MRDEVGLSSHTVTAEVEGNLNFIENRLKENYVTSGKVFKRRCAGIFIFGFLNLMTHISEFDLDKSLLLERKQ